jgi:hypothetical protein
VLMFAIRHFLGRRCHGVSRGQRGVRLGRGRLGWVWRAGGSWWQGGLFCSSFVLGWADCRSPFALLSGKGLLCGEPRAHHGNRAEPSGSSQSRHGRYYGLACARDLAFSESRALQSDARRADLRGGATSAARAFSAAAEAQADGQK